MKSLRDGLESDLLEHLAGGGKRLPRAATHELGGKAVEHAVEIPLAVGGVGIATEVLRREAGRDTGAGIDYVPQHPAPIRTVRILRHRGVEALDGRRCISAGPVEPARILEGSGAHHGIVRRRRIAVENRDAAASIPGAQEGVPHVTGEPLGYRQARRREAVLGVDGEGEKRPRRLLDISLSHSSLRGEKRKLRGRERLLRGTPCEEKDVEP